ncbi:MAG TPA: hypothetical protein VIQ30_00260 [Pseudonocardia sp.]
MTERRELMVTRHGIVSAQTGKPPGLVALEARLARVQAERDLLRANLADAREDARLARAALDQVINSIHATRVDGLDAGGVLTQVIRRTDAAMLDAVQEVLAEDYRESAAARLDALTAPLAATNVMSRHDPEAARLALNDAL